MTQAPATIASARRALQDLLAHAGIDSADIDARLLIEHALGIDRTTVMTQGARALSADEVAAIDTLVARRLKHEPVARIVGEKEFWSLMLAVTPDVLVPRPDTETVVELALDVIGRERRAAPLRVLDIGTGSGALLLALLSELPNATGVATDISEGALNVARANAERHGLASRCEFVDTDIAAGVQGLFDLIVSNPPYIARNDISGLESEVRDYDPALALDGGLDGLSCYRAITAEAGRLLAPGGHLVVEIGIGQDRPVSGLFSEAGLTVIKTRPDLAGIPRALAAFFAP
ncbi:MAG: peptide chain release factor N(5)-glutamine methyltransferase [Pseudolabrys sp.]